MIGARTLELACIGEKRKSFVNCYLLIFEFDYQEFVAEVLKTIELDEIQDALVGIHGRSGISTEQSKRLTIAVELVSNPSIIFMDEPTSGLDASAAAIVMRAVKNVARTRRTVVCTIHQPGIDIFEAFDEVIISPFEYLKHIEFLVIVKL